MKFDRIRLSNFKCYGDTDLTLDSGVTVIHGLNGSGKSSLLEACFFALYGSTALDRTLDDVVTIGEEDAEVELWFTHRGGEYHVHRRIRATGERARTAKCVLETPEGSVDGAEDVRNHVVGLFRMDAEAFVNCAYVRQGEVNKLINATPSQRQDMIDDLLQLGKLEEYRERASDARLGVKSVLDDRRGSLTELQSQVEGKEEKNLHGLLNDLESKLAEVESEIERFEGNREEARTTLEEARAVLESYEEKREELDDVEEDIETLQSEITETERERDDLRERIGDLRERVDALESDVDDLLAETDVDVADEDAIEARLAELDAADDEVADDLGDARTQAQMFGNQADNLGERADELEERAAEKRQRADELESEAEDADLADYREKLETLGDRIDAERATFEDASVEFGEAETYLEDCREKRDALVEREQELTAERKSLRDGIEEAERLLDAGKCPECGQPVDGSPHVDGLDEDRDRLAELDDELEAVREDRERVESDVESAERLREAERTVANLRDNRESVEQLVDDKETTVTEKREEAESLREEADDLDSEAEDKREDAEQLREKAAEREERVEELEAEREAISAKQERLEEIRSVREKRDELEDEIERRRDERTHLAEVNDERRNRLAEKRDRRDDLREAYDEERIEAARDDEERAEGYLEKVEDKLDDLREDRDDLQGRIGGVKSEIEALEELRDRRDDLRERVEALESLRDEAADLEAMYGDLRAELRQRNVESLERMLNEVFDLVYQNDSYSRIALDGEYQLTVYQKDGEPLDPGQLSGGERALFNLSLRCAIYRLLSEGIEGTAPMPPLILDEPTVFLDSGHVSQLVELVESMRELGVEQIIVVSHDEELVGAADDLVRVEKDATTNRSHVERGATVFEASAGADD
ncbi:DNA double-strand break repair ATPase Rad50 [Halomicrococcus sp. SG-WS-1]|uniref:DNA double-strand break repair ATPase Rad50 n=1 Tax=Halomicrococcus sp. SG-WS-1 TaxID=3439057 RepID=UPI003F791DB3